MKYLQLLSLPTLIMLSLNGFGKSAEDHLLLVHNDTAYYYTADSNTVTTIAQTGLVNITEMITSTDIDTFFSKKQCGDFKNYLFTPVNEHVFVLGFNKTLFSIAANSDITSKSLEARLQFLTSRNGVILAGLCNGSILQMDSSLNRAEDTYTLPDKVSTCLAYHATKPLAAYGVSDTTTTIKIVDFQTGKDKIITNGDAVFFTDQRVFIKSDASDWTEPAVWNVYNLNSFEYESSIRSNNITVSPDETHLFVWHNSILVEGEKATYLRRFKADRTITAAAFSPNNDHLYIFTSAFYTKKNGSETAQYDLYRFNIDSGDTEGTKILQISGKPVHGHLLWVIGK